MTRKRRIALSDIPLGFAAPVESRLKKQSSYGNLPWEPGEIPMRGSLGNVGSLISVSEPHHSRTEARCDFMGVQIPKNDGERYRVGADIAVHEVKTGTGGGKKA